MIAWGRSAREDNLEGGNVRIEQLLDELEVSERTLRRYLKTLNQHLSINDEPIILVAKENGVEQWKLNDLRQIDATHYQLFSLFLGTSLMNCLQGTVIREGLEDIYHILHSSNG